MRYRRQIFSIILIFSFFVSCDDNMDGEIYSHLIGSWIGIVESTTYQNDTIHFYNNVPNNKVIFNDDKTGKIEYSNSSTIQDFIWVYIPSKNEINLMIEDGTSFFSNRVYEILIDKPTEQHWKLEKTTILGTDSIEQLVITEWILEKEE